MSPSSSPAGGPNSAKVTTLPPAGREEMLTQEGLSGSARWDEIVDTDADAQAEELGFLREGGWHVIDIKNSKNSTGGWDGGLTSHRGILRSDEYVDDDVFIALAERELGFSYDDVRAVYRQGRKSDSQRELRGQIDARLLALSRSEGNLLELFRRFGFKVEKDGHCEPLDNALARAKAAEEAAA